MTAAAVADMQEVARLFDAKRKGFSGRQSARERAAVPDT
jgi:hypothetical protein